VLNLFSDTRLNHHTAVNGGVLEDACATLLRDFFAERRAARSQDIEPIPTGESTELDNSPK
jgi:tRNA(adenine34) deaminase